MQKENCAVGETHELALSKIIATFGNTNTDMIVFDNKKFRCLIKDEDHIWNIIEFILNKKIVNSDNFLRLGRLLANGIVKEKNSVQENNNNEQDKQSENGNIEWTRAEYNKQFMSAIEREGIIFDLKLQKEMLPSSEYNYCSIKDFMSGSINDSGILFELIEKGKDGGVYCDVCNKKR